MNRIFRPLLVWLMLLALPFQGFAAAGMLSCVPMSAPSAPHTATIEAGGHDHAAMLRAMAGAQQDPVSMAHANIHHGDGHGDQDGRHDGRHGGGSCASCCLGAAMAPSAPLRLAPARPDSIAIPFHPGHLPSVDPALPERPPQAILA